MFPRIGHASGSSKEVEIDLVLCQNYSEKIPHSSGKHSKSSPAGSGQRTEAVRTLSRICR